jgi:hypothetical protein
MLKQFATYLVAHCFMKMCRQVSHWSSQGFIYYLGQVEAEKLQNAVAQMDVGYTYMGWCNLDLCKNVARTLDLIQCYIIDH